MIDDFSPVGQLLSRADAAPRLSYDEDALSELIMEARTAALPMKAATLQNLMENTEAGESHEAETKTPRIAGWLRRHARGAFTGATALVLAGGLTAGGIAINARTGWFGTPGSENGTSEMIYSGGTSYKQLVADAEPAGLTYPAGLTGADAREWIFSRAKQGQNVYRPEAGIQADYCNFAQGTWELTWKQTLETGDAAGQKNALDHIDEAVDCANERGIWGDGLYELLMKRQSEARAGNPGPLLSDIRINTPIEFPGILHRVVEAAK